MVESIEESLDKETEGRNLNFNVWTKWSPHTSHVKFTDRTDERRSGNGETKVAAEMNLIDMGARATAGSESYDIITADGRKWEVKEFGDMRIERTGLRTAQDGLNTLRSISLAIASIVSDIERLGMSGSVSMYPGLGSLASFSKTFGINVGEGNVPKGLIFGSTRQNPVGLLDITNIFSVIIQDVPAFSSDIAGIALDIRRESDPLDRWRIWLRQDQMKLFMSLLDSDQLERSLSDVISSNYERFGVAEYLNTKSLEECYNKMFNPISILPDIAGVIVVDDESGYFVMEREQLLEYYIPKGLSKGTQAFSVKTELKPKIVDVQPQQMELKLKYSRK